LALGPDTLEHLIKIELGADIEILRVLVEHEQLGIIEQATSKPHTLPLAARSYADWFVKEVLRMRFLRYLF